jgi:ppGpp synthetase/RelA/SpoT-type nucleotidyltranferase
MGKATKIGDDGNRKYGDPLNQIQDQIGARVVVFYLDDVHQISTEIERYYSPIERKELIPDSESEFGYIGKHYILALPDEVFDDEQLLSLPNFFELQIKTLFQHAWSEASHDLAYKAKDELTSHQKRQFAFTAAQAWGADNIFSTLYSELG